MQPTDQARILQSHETQGQTRLTSNKCNFEAIIAAVTLNSEDTSTAQVSSVTTTTNVSNQFGHRAHPSSLSRQVSSLYSFNQCEVANHHVLQMNMNEPVIREG